MAVPELHFFSGNDVNGPTILEVPVTEDYVERLVVRPALREVGYMAFRFSRHVGFAIFDAGAFQPEVFVRLLVPDVSTTRYLWGCFLNDRVQQLVARVKAGENFDFGGPGPKFYLSRAILWDEQFSGTGYNIDLANGVFRWKETATAGRVLNRLIAEDQFNTIAEFLPDLTNSFSDSNDSNGNPWTNDIAGSDEFELRIGDNYLTDLFKIEDSGDLETTMYLGTVANPVLRLDAWESYGRDLSGAIGASTVHFKEDVNILGDLSVTGASRRKASHALVEGLEDSYGRAVRTTWDPGEYAKAVGISHDTTKNENVLERYGLAWLRRQANGENEILVPHYPGFSQSTGLYFPGPGAEAPGGSATSGHYWIGDTISLTTGGDAGGTWTPLDYRSEDERVMAITMEMRSVVKDGTPTESALSWNVIAELNVERGSDTQPDASSGGGTACKCLQLCRPLSTSGAEFVLSNAVGADSPDMSLGIQPGEADLLLLDFASTNATLAPTAEYQDINNPPTFTDASPQALTELEFVATADHDMALLALDNPDIATGTSARILHDHPDGRHAAVALLYRGATIAGLGDLQSGSGTSAAPSITVATSPGDLVVGAVGWHYYDTVNGWALLIQDPDQTHLASATKSGTHQAAIAAAQKVATGSTTTLSWGLSASRQYSVIAVVLPGSASGGDTIEPVGPTGSSGPGSGSRAADCGHVHGHGFLSTDGLHEHDAARIQWDPDGTSSTASNVQDAIVEALAGDSKAAIPFIFDGGGVEIADNKEVAIGPIPFDFEIDSVTLLADQSGSIVVDIWADTYANYPPVDADSITASAVPTISGATEAQDATLSGWSTTHAAGIILVAHVDSCTTITRCTVMLNVTKT